MNCQIILLIAIFCQFIYVFNFISFIFVFILFTVFAFFSIFMLDLILLLLDWHNARLIFKFVSSHSQAIKAVFGHLIISFIL